MGEPAIGQAKIQKVGIYWRNKFNRVQFCCEIVDETGVKTKGYVEKEKLLVSYLPFYKYKQNLGFVEKIPKASTDQD